MDRIALAMRVKKGQEQEYIRRHDNIWPEIQEDMRRAGIHKMSIFMFDQQLFLYMEVDDYAEAARILEASLESVKWAEYMAPIMESAGGDDYDAANPYPEGLPEVFHWTA